MNKILILLLMVFSVSACKKDYDKIDKERIEDYLKSKGLTAKQTASGVFYIIEKEGKGAQPTTDAEVTIKYKGYNLEDKTFDSRDSTAFYLDSVIPGFSDGLQQFKEGSSGKIFIPSSLAYGSGGSTSGSIKGNEPIAFDVSLLGIDLIDKANKAEIRAYAKKKGWKIDSLPSGLYYVIDQPGTGNNPTINSTVTVNYKGYFTNEQIFDGSTATFPLSNVIKGWQLGIPLFKKGGKGKLLLPSRLGYKNGVTGIPAGSVLIFEIDLIDF
jgi:FKBP-type peptidyl-prolyl cis-trans isomerase FkpA